MLLTNVPLFPRQQLILGLVGVAILFGVQFQPRPVPRHCRTSHHCKYAAPAAPAATQAPLPGHCQRQNKDASELSFGGIGSYVASDVSHDNRFTVVEPLKGTPAYNAGLQPGDVIERIDGRVTQDMPIEQSVAMIRGTEGTSVHLNVYRPSNESRFELDITRATIHAPLPPATAQSSAQYGGCPSASHR